MLITCTQCNGTGSVTPEGSSSPVSCDACKGIGQVETNWVGTITEIRKKIMDLDDGLNDTKDKVNDIKEKVDEIKVVVDEILTKV